MKRPSIPAAVAARPEDAAAERERARLKAEREAIAERSAAGRRSTIVGGALIAADEQHGRGLLAAQRRRSAVAGEVLGG